MKIQALRGTYGDKGFVHRGQVIDVRDDRAKELIGRGLFVPAQDAADERSRKARAKADAKAKADAEAANKKD